MKQNNFNVSTIMNNSELGGEMQKGIAFLGVGRGRAIGGEFTGLQQTVLPTRVKLTFEGIDGRGGYNRSGEPVPVFNDYC